MQKKSIHTVSDTLVLSDIAVLMQGTDPRLFHYASTSREHQHSHSLLKHLSSQLCLTIISFSPSENYKTLSSFHTVFSLTSNYPFIPCQKRRNRVCPSPISAACLRPQSHRPL